MGSPTTAPPPLTAHLTATPSPTAGSATGPSAAHPDHHVDHQAIHLGREKVHWSAETWASIDHAVAHEVHTTSVVPKFLPHRRVAHHITNIEADVVLYNLQAGAPPYAPALRVLPPGIIPPPILNVYEGANISLIELSVEFALSQAQVHKENERPKGGAEHHGAHAAEGHPGHPGGPSQHGHHEYHTASTAVMLARRAANVLALARDAVVFLGANAFAGGPGGAPGMPFFIPGINQAIQNRGIPVDTGLTGIGGPFPVNQAVAVQPVPLAAGAPPLAQYSGNTVGAISTAYSMLAGNGYAGPYACVLHFYEYADSFSPLPTTLVIPADRIKPLLEKGYFSSAVLPGSPTPANPNPGGTPLGFVAPGVLLNPAAQALGLVISLGGNVAEFVNGLDPVTAFSYLDQAGNYIFRVFTRFATKISDVGAIVRLEFI